MKENEAMEIVLSNLLAFFRALRPLGFAIGMDEEQLALRALACVGVADEQICRFAVQAVVVKHREDLPVFQVAWQQFWLSLTGGMHPWLKNHTLGANLLQQRTHRHRHPQVIWAGADLNREKQADVEPAENPVEVRLRTGASWVASLAKRDFADLTEFEQRQLQALGKKLPVPLRRSHRLVLSRRGRTIDVGATIRAGLQQGEWMRLLWRDVAWQPRHVVALCDVSGSMDPYSRMVLRFFHGLTRSRVPLETFTLGTNLTHVTRSLRLRDPEMALLGVLQQTNDFSGGTRLAECLSTFNRYWAHRVLSHEALVVLVTDGLDASHPDALRRAMIQLKRFAARIVWLNPNLRDPQFEPIASGTSVLYDVVDELAPASTWSHLESLWERLSGRQSRFPVPSGRSVLSKHAAR